jgi:cob(I)alamin adenosyltransferase
VRKVGYGYLVYLDSTGYELINWITHHVAFCSHISTSWVGVLLTEKAPPPDMSSARSFSKGLVQVYTGEGKGKTTAAIGTVLRALGNDLKVCIIAFMKAGQPSGEWNILSGLPNVDIERFGSGPFVDPTNITQRDREEASKALEAARQAILGGGYDLVVLDEVNVAVAWQLIGLDEVLRLIEDRPPKVELVLTGRGADKEIVKMADIVTEMLNIKHPYDDGITSRRGIEY